MSATITTKDGKVHKCIGVGDADDIAKKVNEGAKMVKCGGKWIASSTISVVSIKRPENPEGPPSTPSTGVNVQHHHYYSYKD